LLKPWHRFKAAKAAAAYIPTLESGGFSSFPDKHGYLQSSSNHETEQKIFEVVEDTMIVATE
jgi:hypothetical protein